MRLVVEKVKTIRKARAKPKLHAFPATCSGPWKNLRGELSRVH